MGNYCDTLYLLLYRLYEDFFAVFLFDCSNNGVRSTKDDAVGINEKGNSFTGELSKDKPR